MAGLTNYEKVVLGLTAGFVLVSGIWFWTQDRGHGDYQITVTQRREEAVSAEEGQSSQEDWPDSLLPGSSPSRLTPIQQIQQRRDHTRRTQQQSER